MLLANTQTAKRIVKTFPDRSLLRNHPEPNERKLDVFFKFCKEMNMPLEGEVKQTEKERKRKRKRK